MVVKWIDGSRTDFYQNFIVASGRLFNLFTLENIARTIVLIGDSFHVSLWRRLHSSVVSPEDGPKPQRPRRLWRNRSRSSGVMRSQRSAMRSSMRRRTLE